MTNHHKSPKKNGTNTIGSRRLFFQDFFTDFFTNLNLILSMIPPAKAAKGQLWRLIRTSPTDLFAEVVILGRPQYEDVPTVDVAPFSPDKSLAGPNDLICRSGTVLSSMDFSLPLSELLQPVENFNAEDGYVKSLATMSENLFALHEAMAEQIMRLQKEIYIWLDKTCD